MRVIGALLLIAGLVGLFAAMNMDTTVETGGDTIGYGEFSTYVPKSRVHNIGLMDQRRNYMIIGGVAAVIGAILAGFGALAETGAKTSANEQSALRCPLCKGVISRGCQVCQHCRTPLEWIHGTPMTPEQATAEETRLEASRRKREDEERQSDVQRRREREQKRQYWEAVRAAARRRLGVVASFPRKSDDALRSMVGEENAILHYFARGLVVVVLVFVTTLLVCRLFFIR